MSFEWYTEFIDLDHKPQDELICVFKVDPDGISMDEAAGRVASESSVGTWTTLAKLPDRIKRLMGRVYEMDGNTVKVAYPLDLFEEGNVAQLLSSVAGNIFGMRALKNLRLEDIYFPQEYSRNFKGPILGIEGVQKIFNESRPLTATVPKPKVGFDADEYSEVAYQAWTGGIDFVKDDENLTSQPFIKFEDRLEKVMKVRDKAEEETGEKKVFLVNITAETGKMEERAKQVADYGNEYIMVDVVTAGWSAVQSIREVCEDLNLGIHAHRAMHAAFTRDPLHGISLNVLVKLGRLVGLDNFHVGTGVGKMYGAAEEVVHLADICRRQWGDFKKVYPVSSGGLHPGLVPAVIDLFGNEVIIQAGGGVHGHPDGTFGGARALRQSIDLSMNGEDLRDAADRHPELSRALEKWEYISPK